MEELADLNKWEIIPLGIGRWCIRKTPDGKPQMCLATKGFKSPTETYKPLVIPSEAVFKELAEGIANEKILKIIQDIDKINNLPSSVKLPKDTKAFFSD